MKTDHAVLRKSLEMICRKNEKVLITLDWRPQRRIESEVNGPFWLGFGKSGCQRKLDSGDLLYEFSKWNKHSIGN